jgi:Ca2+:H+ antiporter
MTRNLKFSLDWLLVFFPAAVTLHYAAPELQTLTFIVSCLAVIPLAGWMGQATEHLAEKTGEGAGGLLNATFGNAAELIIALAALQRGMYDVVKASLTGSIIGNILLVLGGAMVAGGLRHKIQRFNAQGARSQASMLTLAAIALVLPAAYHYLGGRDVLLHETGLSLEIAVVLLVTYALSLLFSLRTHKHLFTGPSAEAGAVEERAHNLAPWSLRKSLLVLAFATAMVVWVSEILVGTVEHAARAFGMTGVFVGVIVVAVIGNAAEHSTALMAAVHNRMDLSIGIAVGSSIQIALFVAPVLVLASLFIGPKPMDLVFTLPEILAVVVAAAIAGQVTSDGESHWLEGVQLLSVYIILGMVFYFLPSA